VTLESLILPYLLLLAAVSSYDGFYPTGPAAQECNRTVAPGADRLHWSHYTTSLLVALKEVVVGRASPAMTGWRVGTFGRWYRYGELEGA
jgi:hypothetical protein